MARPEKQEIALSELERKTLLELTKSRVTPHGLVRRAEIVLAICRWRDEHNVQPPGIPTPDQFERGPPAPEAILTTRILNTTQGDPFPNPGGQGTIPLT